MSVPTNEPDRSGRAPDVTDVIAAAIARLDPGLEDRLDADPQAHLDLVVLTHHAHVEVGGLLRSSVTSARAAGWSWEAIGAALGMSRQAAQQRFGRSAVADPEAGENRRLVGLTAMSEMTTLNEWGRHGWQSVGYGPMFHDVQKSEQQDSDVQWEHRRVLVGGRAARGLEQDGWERIGSMWFPWVYFKRPTDVAAEPGEPR